MAIKTRERPAGDKSTQLIDHVVGFRPSHLSDDLLARGRNPSDAAKTAMTWHFILLKRAMRQTAFTIEEAQALLEALRGVDLNEEMLDLVWARVDQTVRRLGLDAKIGFDRETLLRKVYALNDTQTYAVVDAVARYWRNHDPAVDEIDGLRAVGLVA